MRIPGGPALRAGLLLLVLPLVAPSGVLGGEDQEFLRPFRGVVFDLLRDFREGDDAIREKASEGLLARGEFVLPYVLVAAEATPDEGYRDRLLALAAGIRAELPPRSRLEMFRGGADLPGFAEYPPWDVVAGNLIKNRWRADAEVQALYADPVSIDTALVHVDAERWEAALECLIAFARAHPDRIEEALEVARWRTICDREDLAERVAVLEAMAARIAESAPPERASMIAFRLANLLRSDRLKQLAAVAKTWGAEAGGLFAQHELIEDSGKPGRERFTEQLALCAKHPGTRATFYGLRNAIFQLSTVNLIRKDFNSLARLRGRAPVAARLTSDEFAGGAGCLKVAKETADFYISDDLSPEEAKVMLEAFRTFFAHHFLVDALAGSAVTFDYYLKSKFTKLHGVLGVPKEEIGPVILKELSEIEQQVPEAAPVRCFTAIYLAELGRTAEALDLLEKLQADFPDRFFGRKALALQATILYRLGDLATARELYARYARRHPTSAYAWVAGLRAGHAAATAGLFNEAIQAYERARARFPRHPLVSVLVPLSLGRVFEEKGALAEALTQYRSALAAWPLGCKDRLGTPLQGPGPRSLKGFDPDVPISREDLSEKIRELDRPGIDPAELALHLRAKRQKERGETESAVARWQEFLESHPGSPLSDEVRSVLGRTLIESALVATTKKEAEHALMLAATEGDRFAKFSVEFFRAIADLGVEGGADVAGERLGNAMAIWERDTVLAEPESDLRSDIAAIRRLVFRPRSRAFFHQGYEPESWPRYSIVTPEVTVKFPDGSKQTVTLRQAYPEVKGVLDFTIEEVVFLRKIIDGLGGNRRTNPAGVMALPQPKGAAKTIQEFLGEFIQITPGHWGGWHLGTFPIINTISFLDAERTAATVEFRVRYRGGEASLVRGEDGWELGEVKLTWME